ncbi:uncharacterized protein LOC132737285 [Ruditapes philippinarum]|uniref:uncharacterized protein LOC132737285 n=1 Tax=Ruditapes philippinarum TaxID=129788 RepID=UPI00295A8D5E|nr:uncharacterized protein LOC132737285 [Ruditapes philippinarum]
MRTEIITFSLVCLVGCVYSAAHTTKYPRTTIPYYAHSESSQIRFAYDQVLHQLIAITGSTCFLAPLNRDERDHIHSSTGMTELEEKMMKDWIGKLAETKIYHDDTHLPETTLHWCARRDIYLLERNMNVMTSPHSVLG